MKYNFRIQIRIFLVLLWLIAFGFFMIKFIVPGGKITYTSDFSKRGGFIYDLTPKERIDDTSEHVKVIDDPVYFSLHYPRQFQKADISLRYKWENVDKQVLEAGILADKKLWQYQLKPLENTSLEKALDSWQVISEGDLIFLQKNKEFNSLKEYLNSDFIREKTAVYNLETQDLDLKPFSLSEVNKEKISPYSIEQDLIGGHEFYMYHPGGDFSVNLKVQDLNRNKDEDLIEIFVFYQDQVIHQTKLEPIVKVDSSSASKIKNIDVNLANLEEALYKVQIKVSDDIIIKGIKTNSNSLVFIDSLYLGDTNQNIKVYTDKDYLKTVTTKPASLQLVDFEQEEFALEETYRQHYFKLNQNNNKKWKAVELNQGNLEISNSGVFSFDKEFAFNPEMTNLRAETNLDNIDYIIAKYKKVKQDGNWRVASSSFDLNRAYSEDNKYNFILSLPDFSYKNNQALIIDSIEITLTGKTIWEKIQEIIN